MIRRDSFICGFCNHRWIESQGGARIVDCPNCGQPVRKPDEEELPQDEAGQARRARPASANKPAPATPGQRSYWRLMSWGGLLVVAVAGILLFLDYNRQTNQISDLERAVASAEREAEWNPPRDPETVRLFLASLRLKMSDLQAMSGRWVSERRSILLERFGKLIQRYEGTRGGG